MDIFNLQAPPSGFNRATPGWILLKKTPGFKAIQELKVNNKELKKVNNDLHYRLKQLEDLVSSLIEKKGE